MYFHVLNVKSKRLIFPHLFLCRQQEWVDQQREDIERQRGNF